MDRLSSPGNILTGLLMLTTVKPFSPVTLDNFASEDGVSYRYKQFTGTFYRSHTTVRSHAYCLSKELLFSLDI
jgi:hypothetical protein